MNATPRPHYEEIDWLDYVLGETDIARADDLSEHLDGCERCRRSVEEYERLARAIPAAAYLAGEPAADADRRDAAVLAEAMRSAGERTRSADRERILREAYAEEPGTEAPWSAALVAEARALSRELLRTDRELGGRIARGALEWLDAGGAADARDDRAALRSTFAYVLGMAGRFDDATALFDRARPEIERLSAVPEIELAFWHFARCSAFYHVGRNAEALVEIRASAALYELLEDDNRLDRCRQTEAVILTTLGHPEEALAIDRRLLEDPRAEVDAPLYASLVLNYGSDLLGAGRLEEARSVYARALDRLRRTGQDHLAFRVRVGLAKIAETEGRLEDALAIDLALRADMAALAAPWDAVLNELEIAGLLLKLRRPAEAAEVCRALVERCEKSGLPRKAGQALAYLLEAEEDLDVERVGKVHAFIRRVERGEDPAWSAA